MTKLMPISVCYPKCYITISSWLNYIGEDELLHFGIDPEGCYQSLFFLDTCHIKKVVKQTAGYVTRKGEDGLEMSCVERCL